MAAYAYYLITIVSLVSGHVEVETKPTQFPTEAECLYAAMEAKPFLADNQLVRCDPGGPDIPTQMELESGE
jgi:hypothetical protein